MTVSNDDIETLISQKRTIGDLCTHKFINRYPNFDIAGNIPLI